MSDERQPIRTAPTLRGQDTMTRILKTAQTLLEDHWLSDLSISALAKKADVKRTSLLLRFPNGWSDIAVSLADQLLFNPFDQRVISILDGPRSKSIAENTVYALDTFVELGTKSGRLVANLRSHMFVWGDENNELFHIPAQDYNEEFAELLAGDGQTVTDNHRFVAEALINFALDVAGGVGLYPWTTKERRELVRKHVEIALAGLNSLVAKPR